MKRGQKIGMVIITGVLALIMVVCLLIYEGALNGFILRQVLAQADRFLNGTTAVGKLTGNPFAGVQIHDITLTQNGKECLSASEVDLKYRLFPLLHNELVITSVRISDLKTVIRQEPDSSWNIQKLFKGEDTTAEIKHQSNTGLTVKVAEADFSKLFVKIHPLDTSSLIPKEIEADLKLSFLMQNDLLELKLNKMALKSFSPSLEIRNFGCNFRKDSASYGWDHFRMELPRTSIVSEGEYFPHQKHRSQATLAIDTLAFENLRNLFPHFKLKGNPSLLISAKMGADKIFFSVVAREQLQKGEITGWVKEAGGIPEYEINLNVANIDGSIWTGDIAYTSKITGNLQAKGLGSDPRKGPVRTSGNFSEMTFRDKSFRNLIFKAEADSLKIKGNVAADAWFGALQADFNVADYLTRFRYNVTGSGRNIDLAQLYLPTSLYSALNLTIVAKGEGMNPLKGSVMASVTSSNSTITNRPIEDFHAAASYKNGQYELTDLNLMTPYFKLTADGNGNLKSENKFRFKFRTKDFNELLKLTGYGQFRFDGSIQGEVSGSTQQYRISSLVDISRFTKDWLTIKDLSGNLNLQQEKEFRATAVLTARGIGIDTIEFQKVGANFDFMLGDEPSLLLTMNSDTIRINNKMVGSLIGEVTLQSDDSLQFNTKIILDTLNYHKFKTGVTTFNLKSMLPKGDREKGLSAALHELTEHFNPIILENYLTGIQHDSLGICGRLDLNHFSYDSLTIKDLAADLRINTDQKNFWGNLSASAKSMNIGGFRMKRGKINTTFLNKDFWNEMDIYISDSTRAAVKAEVSVQEDFEIRLRHILLKTPFDTWLGGGDSTRISYKSEGLAFRNLSISAGENKQVSAEGFYAFKGQENLCVNLRGLDLQNVNTIMRGPIPVSGTLDGSLKITGTSASPVINADVNVKALTVSDQKIDRVNGNLHYSNDSIAVTTNLDVHESRILEAGVGGHYRLSIEGPFLPPSPKDKLSAQLKLNHFDLALLTPFLPQGQMAIKGYLDSDLKAVGTSDHLDVNGYFNWKEGSFHMPAYGILYDKILLKSGIKGDSLYIDNFSAEAGAGTLKLNGYTRINLHDIYQPKAISFKLSGKDFKAIDSELLQTTVNTDITLRNEKEHSVFAGELAVIRSEANADAFISKYNKAKDKTDLPMLIKAKGQRAALSEKKVQDDTIEVKINRNIELYKNLKGNLIVRVPGNMWIRGKDMAFELKGDLRAMKEGANMMLYGNLEVKQGFFRIYGKRFDFKSGKITLTGEEEVNPMVDFVVYYAFRDPENQQKSLEMTVTGRLKEPQFAYRMDGSKLDEQDALSYMLFGCSMNQLTDSQSSAVDISGSAIARNMALGQVSSVLQDAVQSSLKLDVVEITGDNNWAMGNVIIGKYITKDLFIKYQYTFALDKKTKIIEPRKISIEYQIFKFLSLTGTNQSPNSGLDLLFKKEFK